MSSEFSYRRTGTLISAFVQVIVGCLLAGIFFFVVYKGFEQSIAGAGLLVMGAIGLFLLTFIARDGIVWILRFANERFVVEGNSISHFDIYGKLRHEFALSEVTSVRQVPGPLSDRGYVILSLEARYWVRAGRSTFTIFNCLNDGADLLDILESSSGLRS